MNRKLALSATGPFLLASAALLAFGDLNPPAGPVGATGKPLTELEPRIAISATNTPGDATNIYRITQSGSYYLTSNVFGASGKNCITVTVSGVTIDLNGFGLYGGGAATSGIVASPAAVGLKVTNGTISAWGNGGIDADSTPNCEITDIYSDSNHVASIAVGGRSAVRRCKIENANATAVLLRELSTVEDTTITGSLGGISSTGLSGCTVERVSFFFVQSQLALGPQSTVRQCSSLFGGGNFTVGERSLVERCSLLDTGGFVLGDGSRIADCTVNRAAGIGFRLGQDCVATGCIATLSTGDGFQIDNRNVLVDCSSNFNIGDGFQALDGNSFEGCRAESNQGDGFRVRFGNQIRSCAARANSLDGFETSAGGHIVGCESDSNGFGAGNTGANILATGNGCRIEGNSLIGGDFGIQATATGSVFFQNSSTSCPNHYGGIIAGNQVGPIGSAATATSPFANLQY